MELQDVTALLQRSTALEMYRRSARGLDQSRVRPAVLGPGTLKFRCVHLENAGEHYPEERK